MGAKPQPRRPQHVPSRVPYFFYFPVCSWSYLCLAERLLFQCFAVFTMAEVLGSTSGAAGLAGFALQVVDATKKLNTLWSDIEDAPAELAALSHELATLGSVLAYSASISPSATNLPLPISMHMEQCHRDCEKGIANLNETVKQLERQVTKRRYIGGFKFSLKKEAVKNLRANLENAKSTLLLMQQASFRYTKLYFHSSRIDFCSS